jgi:hypothetical protein
MLKYKDAYYEASEIMIKHSIHKDRFGKIFNLPQLCKIPSEDEL